MRLIKYLFVILLAISLNACGYHNPAPASGYKHTAAKQVLYLDASVFKTLDFPLPPVAGSQADKADFHEVMRLQKSRTPADCARAAVTADATYATYEYLWGNDSPFPEPLPAPVKEFFGRVEADAAAGIKVIKRRFSRPRPFISHSEVEPCLDKYPGFSYPSGHSFFAWMYAAVLSDINPERKSGFAVKAAEIAEDRVVGGVHYPADIAAGKVFADQFHELLLKNPDYVQDIEKLKLLLRSVPEAREKTKTILKANGLWQ